MNNQKKKLVLDKLFSGFKAGLSIFEKAFTSLCNGLAFRL